MVILILIFNVYPYKRWNNTKILVNNIILFSIITSSDSAHLRLIIVFLLPYKIYILNFIL